MTETVSFAGDRLAKVIARAGLCSRRDAELWIKEGRVAVNGKVIRTPAFNVTEKDQVRVDGQPLVARQGTRVWLYHKPAGLVVTEKDPEGRATIFDTLEQQGLPRVVSVGRLDINTEGLLLLTNDGGLKRVLELPATGWLRKYRVRAFGSVTQAQLDALKDGVEIDGTAYGPIEATLEREQGSNVWLLLALREGKNREVKNVLGALGLQVNRLIRVSFGPFQLNDLPIGAVEVVKARVLRDQLGKRLADEAGVDFDSELPEPAAIKRARGPANPALRAAAPGREPAQQRKAMADRTERFRFTDRPDRAPRDIKEEDRAPRKDRPGGRFSTPRPVRAPRPEAAAGPPRTIFHADGTASEFKSKTYGKKPGARSQDSSPAPRGRGTGEAGGGGGPKRDFSKSPRKDFADKPRARSQDSSPASRGRGTGEAGGGGGPKRDFGKSPRKDFADKPRGRSQDSSPASRGKGTGEAGGGGGPKRDFSKGPRKDFGDKPRGRSQDSSPASRGKGTGEAGGGGGPKRDFGKGPRKDFGDKPRGRSQDSSPASRGRGTGEAGGGGGPKRPYSPRPAAAGADRPKRPYSPRPAGAPGKPVDKRPRGSGPGGDRPRRPRPTRT